MYISDHKIKIMEKNEKRDETIKKKKSDVHTRILPRLILVLLL